MVRAVCYYLFVFLVWTHGIAAFDEIGNNIKTKEQTEFRSAAELFGVCIIISFLPYLDLFSHVFLLLWSSQLQHNFQAFDPIPGNGSSDGQQ